MSIDTGYDFEQVGKLTVARYEAIYRYLGKRPPVQRMLQSMLGIETGAGGGSGPDIDINDIDLPPGGLRIGGL